ncbi:DUF6538 domain-containing protein, partial [Maliponia aquimaris]|uniref:DUF6538 domain-containing protein n=1 Tax=Maliponia aquimaris TaxID=1673631 RepID=UPI001595275A
MAGKVRHLVNRSGRYHARLVVPNNLRGIIGKTELRTPLGGDYRTAIKLLPGAVARLQAEILDAERRSGQRRPAAPARYPMAADQMALSLYTRRLLLDDELRNDPRWASVSINDLLVSRLREAVAGRASDAVLTALVGNEIEQFRASGNLDAQPGSMEWRAIARALCHGELEALAHMAERDEGDFTGVPASPIIVNAQPPETARQPVSLERLWDDYVRSRLQIGAMRDGGKRQAPVIKNLRAFLRHDDATRVAKKDLLAWREHLLNQMSAKTVSDIYLSTVRSLFTWAVENDRLPENVAATVKQPKPKRIYGRERGFTTAEALRVLRASRAYEPTPDGTGRVREGEKSVGMKRRVPLICAFTGARVGEIVQLRKEDVREIDGRWVLRITPDAGTVKAGDFRDVPLHHQVIEKGFVDFVRAAADGPLFHNESDPKKYWRAVKIVGNKLSDWLRKSELTPEGLQPNHAWRHAFKTRCRELGKDCRRRPPIRSGCRRPISQSARPHHQPCWNSRPARPWPCCTICAVVPRPDWNRPKLWPRPVWV